jgi:hypothetical protein
VEVPAEQREAVRRFVPGDAVWTRLARDPDRVLALRPVSRPVSRARRSRAILAAVGVLALCLGFLRWYGVSVHRLLVGKDGRYSNSKVQAALWFAVFVIVYAAAWWIRAWESGWALVRSPGIPLNLAILSGLSALTYYGATAITKRRVEQEMETIRAAQGGGPPAPPPEPGADSPPPPSARLVKLRVEAERRVKPPAAAPDLVADLVSDDKGHPDIGDVQMLVVTLLAVATYLVQAFTWLSTVELVQAVDLPDVGSTILTLFGIGQGAYLAKKSVANGA